MKKYYVFIIVGDLICSPINAEYFQYRCLPKEGEIIYDHSNRRLGIVSRIEHDNWSIYINSNPDYVYYPEPESDI